MDTLTRRQVRYICFRLKTAATGGESASGDGFLEHADEIKDHFESQDDFDGWKQFGVTWDVGEKAHLVAVILKQSHASTWNRILKKEAKPFPSLPISEDLPDSKAKKSSKYGRKNNL